MKIIPNSWNTLSNKGESFYNSWAKKIIEKLKNDYIPMELLKSALKENFEFANTEEGNNSESFSKETQLEVIEFLKKALDKDGITENEIIDTWHNTQG